MEQSLERELKSLVTKEIFEKAKKRVVWANYQVKHIKQVNYFYDTPSQYYNQNDITIRIRKNMDGYFLQTKTFADEAFTRIEREMCLQNLPKQINLDVNFFEEFNGMNQEVVLQGALLTFRTSLFYSDSLRIDFDESHYWGECDYEIEIEYEPEEYEIAVSLQKQLIGDQLNDFIIGKRTRFYNKMKNL